MSDSFNLDIAAFHEAAHAVMAAYIGLPFVSADAIYVPDVRKGATVIGGAFEEQAGSYSLGEMLALFLLAPRAAVEKYTNLPADLFPGAGSYYEPGFSDDEQQLRELAKQFDYGNSVSFETMFERFRPAYLSKAKTIIATPHIWRAVEQTAAEIKDAATKGERVSSERVKAILNRCRDGEL